MAEEREERRIRRQMVVFLVIFVLFILLVPFAEKREYYGGPVYGRGYGPYYY